MLSLEKLWKIFKKRRVIKLVTTNKERNALASELNYHTTNWFSDGLLAIEMKTIKVKMNKPGYMAYQY